MALERYALVGLLFSIFFLVIDFYLIKKRKINGSTFVLWLAISIGIGTFSVVPAVYLIILEIVGTEVLISAITAVGFLFLLLIIFYLHIMVNELRDKVLKLTAEVSALQFKSNDKDEK